jgi:hypothetical protein
LNPTEIKVGITSLKTLRGGRGVIEAGSKKEIDSPGDKIGKVCRNIGGEYTKAKDPRMIILNTPVDITPENVSEKLIQLNPELAMKEGSIVPKLCYTTKRGTRNLVIEVNSEIRKKTPTQQS